jgi:predicted nucleic acid-binding protein
VSGPVCVLDASVGVKWFRQEPGSEHARRLLVEHVRGQRVIAVDTLFLYEVLAVSARERVADDVVRVWRDLERVELAVVPPSERLLVASAEQRTLLGCSLYDAFSAGLASLLGVPLYTADARAHGGYAEAVLLRTP